MSIDTIAPCIANDRGRSPVSWRNPFEPHIDYAKINNHHSLVCRIALLAMVLLPVGCSCSDSGPQPGPPAARPDKAGFTIGMSQSNLEEPWRVRMNADIEAAAKKHADLKVIFQDAGDDTPTQVAQVEAFINRGVDLIIISPKEVQPLTAPTAKAFEAGIPVVVLDRAVIGDKYTCFIAADNEQIGRAAGTWLVKKLNGKGRIIELKGLMTSAPARDRRAGFREALVHYPDIRIIFEVDMQWREAEARKEMEGALGRFERIDAVFAHNDPGAHGAYLAAKAVDRAKDIIFVGIDALPPEGIAYVKQGILAATFECPTGGREAVAMAMKILADEEVPKNIVLDSRYFTAENVEQGGAPIEELQ